MLQIRQSATFLKWERRLRDERARAVIAARIDRLACGLVGDAKSVGGGVMELRIHYGPGYRIYFIRRGGDIVVLLCGGDKASQDRVVSQFAFILRALSPSSFVTRPLCGRPQDEGERASRRAKAN